MANKEDRNAGPRGFWEKAEDLLKSVFNGSKIDWRYRTFKSVLLADNPFLKRAPEALIKDAFDYIEFGASPPHSSVVFDRQPLKYANAIRAIKPSSFASYHIVKLEEKGLSVLKHYRPDLEGSPLEARVLDLKMAGFEGHEFELLDRMRLDAEHKAALQFIGGLIDDRPKAAAVAEYLEAAERHGDSFYYINPAEYQVPWRDYSGYGHDVDSSYERDLTAQRERQNVTGERLKTATECLVKHGLQPELVDALGINRSVLEDLIHSIELERWMSKQAPNLQRQVSQIADKFQIDITKGVAKLESGESAQVKGISM